MKHSCKLMHWMTKWYKVLLDHKNPMYIFLYDDYIKVAVQ